MGVIGWVIVLLLAAVGCAGVVWHLALWVLTPHPRPRCVRIYFDGSRPPEQLLRYARAVSRSGEQTVLLCRHADIAEKQLCERLGGKVISTPEEAEQMFEILLQSAEL